MKDFSFILPDWWNVLESLLGLYCHLVISECIYEQIPLVKLNKYVFIIS